MPTSTYFYLRSFGFRGTLIIVLLIVSLVWGNLFANRLLEFAYRSHENKEYDKAEQFYLEILRQIEKGKSYEDSNPAIINYNLANLYYETGRLGLAIYYYEKVIDIVPEFKFSYHNLGKLYFLNQSYPQALKVFNSYLEIDPNDYETHLLLGDIYQKIGLMSDALKHYEQANAIHSADPSGYIAQANTYAELDDSKRAVKSLEKFESQGKKSSILKKYQAELLLESEEPFQAYVIYQELLSDIAQKSNTTHESNNDEIYSLNIKKINALLRTGMTNFATAELEKLVWQYPQEIAAIYLLEDVYHQNRRKEKLYQFFKHFYFKNPSESLRIIKQLLATAYNENDNSFMKEMISFLQTQQIKDDLLYYLENQSRNETQNAISR